MTEKRAKDAVSSFRDFFNFLKQPRQKKALAIALAVYTALFLLIHYAYPFPDTFPDTGAYIQWAKIQQFGSFRPIGFSMFLAMTHSISESYLFFFAAQFLLHAFSTLFLFLTIIYFFQPKSQILYYLILALIVLNPAALYLPNFIMSDSLFISLTNFWIATSIWIIGTRSYVFIALHLLALYCVTQVRYTGLFYPLISIIAILFAFRNKYLALAISVLPVLVMYFLVEQTKKGTKKHIGVEMFSGFSGWQMANNALHIIPHIDLKPEEIKDKEIRFVHQMVLNTRDSTEYPQNDLTVNFIWDNKGPLKAVLFASMQHSRAPYLPSWYRVSKPLGKYGAFLMKKYPLEFARYYLLINLKKLFYPSAEIIGRYEQNAPDIAKEWFHLEGKEFKPRSLFFHNIIAPALPAANLLGWIAFFAVVIFSLVRIKNLKFLPWQKHILWTLLIFGAVYCAFSVYAGPIVLRYVTPINAIQVIIAFILINNQLKPANESVKRNQG